MPQQQRKLLSPQELQPLFNQIAQAMKGAVKQDPDPTANFNAVKKQVTMALQSALAQRGGAIQDVAGSVNEIMQMMGVHAPAPAPKQLGTQQPAAPAPMQPSPTGGYEDPGLAQFRKSRQ